MELEIVAKALKELGHPTRLRVYKHLVKSGHSGLPVGKLQEELGIPGSTLSHHISGARLCRADSATARGGEHCTASHNMTCWKVSWAFCRMSVVAVNCRVTGKCRLHFSVFLCPCYSFGRKASTCNNLSGGACGQMSGLATGLFSWNQPVKR